MSFNNQSSVNRVDGKISMTRRADGNPGLCSRHACKDHPSLPRSDATYWCEQKKRAIVLVRLHFDSWRPLELVPPSRWIRLVPVASGERVTDWLGQSHHVIRSRITHRNLGEKEDFISGYYGYGLALPPRWIPKVGTCPRKVGKQHEINLLSIQCVN